MCFTVCLWMADCSTWFVQSYTVYEGRVFIHADASDFEGHSVFIASLIQNDRCLQVAYTWCDGNAPFELFQYPEYILYYFAFQPTNYFVSKPITILARRFLYSITRKYRIFRSFSKHEWWFSIFASDM